MIFETHTGATVKYILPDDKANEAFDELDGNIKGVDWEVETEIKEPAAHMLHLNNNQYAAISGEEDDEDNDTESTGVENNGKITGVRHDDKTKGVDSDKK